MSSYKTKTGTRRNSGRLKADRSRMEPAWADLPQEAESLLSAEAEHELAKRIKAGDDAAREALTLANIRLVVKIARQFKTRGLELDDLIQEGNLGLLRATQDFDPEEHGTRFSTYASNWIRSYIMRITSDDGSMIHFPYYLVILRKRFDRAKSEIASRRRAEPSGEQGEPSIEDVARHMGIEARRLRFLRHAQVGVSSYSTSTLDAEDAGATEAQISELRPPEQPLETAEEMEGLYTAIATLPRFEAWLIKRRFRLDDHDDDAKTKRGKRSPARPRPRSNRADSMEARRIKRFNELTDEPRSYRDIENECGLAVYRLKQIESQALERLRAALARASHSATRLPLPAPQPPRRAPRRASA